MDVYVEGVKEPLVLDEDGRLDLTALQLDPATILLNGKLSLVDKQGRTKRDWGKLVELLEQTAQSAAAIGSADNPLIVSGKSLVAPLPAQHCSYTSIASAWRKAGVVEQQTYLHRDSEEFGKFWEENEQKLKQLGFKAEVCIYETGNEEPYKHGGQIVAGIWEQIVHSPEPQRSGRRTRSMSRPKANFFVNRAAKLDKTQIDSAFIGNEPEVSPQDVYEWVKLVLEYKPNLQEGGPGVRETSTTTGEDQLIDRAERASKAQKLDPFVLPAAITDNRLIKCALVQASSKRGFQRLTINKRLLRLMREDSIDALGRGKVDTTSIGYQELVFLTWHAAVDSLRLKAGEEASMLFGGPGPKRVSLLSNDGTSVAVDLCEVLSRPGLGGAVYAGRLVPSSVPVVFKTGPVADIVEEAKVLCVQPELLYQVQCEEGMLKRLGSHSHPSLPQRLHFGHCEGPSGRVPVLITKKYGEGILLQGGELPRLSERSQLLLAADLLSAFLVLKAHGIIHCDVHLGNIGRYASSEDRERIYVFDLGAATISAEPQLQHTPPCSPLYSSLDVVKGYAPAPLSDVESLVYCLLALSGARLPWDAAAAVGDRMGCITARVRLMADPRGSGVLAALPDTLQSFCENVLRACYDDRLDTEPTLQTWADKLYEAALKTLERLEKQDFVEKAFRIAAWRQPRQLLCPTA